VDGLCASDVLFIKNFWLKIIRLFYKLIYLTLVGMYTHIDIRNFYAACEQYLNPEYKGKPIAVYNESSFGNRKIIAVSKEVKERYGLSRDSSVNHAERFGVKLIESRLKEYGDIALKLFNMCVEHVGNKHSVTHPHIDDIVMEVPDLKTAMGLSREVEKEYNKLGFDIAIGISFNKDYADLATKMGKKYGLTYFGKGFAMRFFHEHPVIEFPNIGPKRQEQLNKIGIFTIGDIADSHLNIIEAALGKNIGRKIYFSVKSIDLNDAQLEMLF